MLGVHQNTNVRVVVTHTHTHPQQSTCKRKYTHFWGLLVIQLVSRYSLHIYIYIVCTAHIQYTIYTFYLFSGVRGNCVWYIQRGRWTNRKHKVRACSADEWPHHHTHARHDARATPYNHMWIAHDDAPRVKLRYFIRKLFVMPMLGWDIK